MTADEVGGDGAFARLVDRLIANRVTVGGVLVFGFVGTMIVTNALFLQDARHPGPLFATREMPRQPAAATPAAQPAAPAVKDIASVVERSGEQVGSIPPASLPPAPPRRPDIGSLLQADSALVTDVQRRLQGAHFYNGAIDGIFGSRTRAAIKAYERAKGLPVTGTPSEQLLASFSPAAPTPQSMPPVPHPAPQRQAGDPAAVRGVQTALNAIGYGPVSVDGELGGTTSEAIRRFELDNGMTITGTVSDRLVSRLVAIGAINGQR